MASEYRVINGSDPVVVQLRGYSRGGYSRDEYSGTIVRFEAGLPIEIIGEDGGEPEDQSFGRDLSWVAPALNRAAATAQAAHDRDVWDAAVTKCVALCESRARLPKQSVPADRIRAEEASECAEDLRAQLGGPKDGA